MEQETPYSFEMIYFSRNILQLLDSRTYTTYMVGSMNIADQDDNIIEEIARTQFRIFNLGPALNDDFDIEQISEDDPELEELFSNIYNFDTQNFNEKILDLLDHVSIGTGFVLIDQIQVLEALRENRLAWMIIKDIKNRFANGLSLIIVRIRPLQHYSEYLEEDKETDPEWYKKMNLEKLEQDKEKAFYKLAAYFQSMGFKNLPGTDFFFLNNCVINPVDDINLLLEINTISNQ